MQRTRAQLIPRKKGCCLISLAPSYEQSRFLGSLCNNRYINCLAGRLTCTNEWVLVFYKYRSVQASIHINVRMCVRILYPRCCYYFLFLKHDYVRKISRTYRYTCREFKILMQNIGKCFLSCFPSEWCIAIEHLIEEDSCWGCHIRTRTQKKIEREKNNC